MTRRAFALLFAALVVSSLSLQAGSTPVRARTGMVVSQNDIASQVGFQVIKSGGNAVDAAVATAFALAVTHPTAGNIGGGGFIVFRPASGAADDVRLPRDGAGRRRRPTMWLKDGKYDYDLHHNSHRSVGVPGTVAGLHMAWKELGTQAVEGPGRARGQAGARRLRGQPRPGALAGRHAREPTTSRSTPPRWRSSRRTACPTRRATS